MVSEHLPLAVSIARRTRFYKGMTTADDVAQNAALGLCDAVARSTEDHPCDTYLAARIKGEIYDQMRRVSWGPRAQSGSGPEQQPLPFADLTAFDPAEEDDLEAAEARADLFLLTNRIKAAVTTRELDVLRELFLDERTEKDVAEEMGVSESRVSQIKSGALKKLRDALSLDEEP